ncbi:MAG: hypothetical protein M1832_001959 [Thelocarpon impressellum]|nr:MAG: hypothetical protein M1832_001959 [Thelocarpon impressellum]
MICQAEGALSPAASDAVGLIRDESRSLVAGREEEVAWPGGRKLFITDQHRAFLSLLAHFKAGLKHSSANFFVGGLVPSAALFFRTRHHYAWEREAEAKYYEALGESMDTASMEDSHEARTKSIEATKKGIEDTKKSIEATTRASRPQ